MKNVLITVLVLSVAACATKPAGPPLGPGGGVLHPVGCVEPIDNCYIEAIKLCEQGFAVVEALEGPRISFAEGVPLLVRGFSLQVECKP